MHDVDFVHSVASWESGDDECRETLFADLPH